MTFIRNILFNLKYYVIVYALFFQAEIQKLQKDILELKNSQPQPCPKNDPNYHLLNDHCIFLEHSKLSYQDAKQNCKIKFGGHGKLYEPLTWSENQMAYKIAKSISSGWWIGVNDKETEGSFVYENNGSPISYTPKFYPGWGSKGTSHNCILAYPPSSGHESDIVHWLDFGCTARWYSICENST